MIIAAFSSGGQLLFNALGITLRIAITPLAFPILAGPDTIASAMGLFQDGSVARSVVVTVAFAILCIITHFCFPSGEKCSTVWDGRPSW